MKKNGRCGNKDAELVSNQEAGILTELATIEDGDFDSGEVVLTFKEEGAIDFSLLEEHTQGIEELICREEGKSLVISSDDKSVEKEKIECPLEATTLSECMDIIPSGIIECETSDIGAVELELQAKRNSIIVLTLPKGTKEYPNAYIIGEVLDEEKLEAYIKETVYKKLLTPVQYLPLLLSMLEHLDDYFLMIEDMDILLQNTYKKEAANILDYYMLFPPNNRCFFTSDADAFNFPLLQDDKRTVIQWRNYEKRQLRVYRLCNIVGLLAELIKNIPLTDKILVVYASVRQARQVILNLPASFQDDCCILCTKNNKKIAGTYGDTLEESDMEEIPQRIVFWTFTNYFGQKLKGKYHLITVANATIGSSTLSLKTIQQIYRLNENPQDILSDSIVYNHVKPFPEWESDYKTLQQRASKMVQLSEAADVLATDDATLTNIFGLAKSVLREKAQGRITGRFASFPLLGKDIHEKNAVAYMNLANMKYRTDLICRYYNKDNSLYVELGNRYNLLPSEYIEITDKAKEQQVKVATDERKLQNKQKAEDRLFYLEEIEKLHEEGKLDGNLLKSKSRRGDASQRRTYKEVATLYDYIETKELISLLKGMKANNSIAFKNLNNAIMFWALADDHPFKLAVKQAFPVGEAFKNTEIQDLLVPMIQYHLHKDLSGKPRKTISLFKAFMNTFRPKTRYFILQNLRFTGHKNRIPKEENNLLRYFII